MNDFSSSARNNDAEDEKKIILYLSISPFQPTETRTLLQEESTYLQYAVNLSHSTGHI